MLTTVTRASGTIPRTAALGWSCSSFIIGSGVSWLARLGVTGSLWRNITIQVAQGMSLYVFSTLYLVHCGAIRGNCQVCRDETLYIATPFRLLHPSLPLIMEASRPVA